MAAFTYDALGRSGRLGNQLWQIAATYGLAKEAAATVRLPKWDYRPYFSCPDEWWGEGGGDSIPAETFACGHIDERQKSYLQCWHYIEGVTDDVRRFFRPSELGQKILDNHIALTGQVWLDDIPEDAISLHVRRGDNADLKTHPIGTWPLVTLDYYAAALAHIDPAGTAPVVVFSDDIPWCEVNLDRVMGGRDYVFVREGPQRDPEYGLGTRYGDQPALDWIDMQLMGRCRHHILANSTYSWWGAFLNEQADSKVAYPNHWVGWRIDQFDYRDLMPPYWVEIDNPVHVRHLERRRR